MRNRMKSRPQTLAGAALLAGAAAVALLARNLIAQSPLAALGSVSDFTTSEYFDKPFEDKVRTTISGAEAQPQPGGKFRIKQLKLERFHETGERWILVQSPECLYDSKERTASSPAHLTVQTGDGRILVEGVGFLWRETNSSLTISNRVRTVISGVTTTNTKP